METKKLRERKRCRRQIIAVLASVKMKSGLAYQGFVSATSSALNRVCTGAAKSISLWWQTPNLPVGSRAETYTDSV